MKNFAQDGDVCSFVAPYALASGDGFLVGSMFAVASNAAANGAAVEGLTEGVVTIKAASADTFSAFAKVYWDNAAKQCTSTAAANTFIGCATVAKVASTVLVNVRLNGVAV